ncbi:hypothetical protein C8J56DRAFT_925753 [Mycena floridula]|nr:hypothetical protein C8J56DRAFT_925753 [Mycena floridula]
MGLGRLRAFPLYPVFRFQQQLVIRRHASTGHTNKLVAALENFLRVAKDRSHIPGFATKLINRSGRSQFRPQMMEAVMHTLLTHRHIEPAISVFSKMLEEGLIPSTMTELHFLAIDMATNPTLPSEEVIHVFTKLLSTISEEDLVQLVATLRAYEYGPKAGMILIELYMLSREEGYLPSKELINLLAGLQFRAGKSNEGFDTLAQYKTEPKNYVTAIAALTDVNPLDWESVDAVLKTMTENDVEVHAALFNVLIRRESKRRSIRSAFELYGQMLTLAEDNPKMIPDAYTYRNLFAILTKLFNVKHYDPNSSVCTPRRLFNDMIKLHFDDPAKRSTYYRYALVRASSDQSLFNNALRAFLSVRDYAGAIVVLDQYAKRDVEINSRTYFTVVRHTLFRLFWDIQRDPRPRAERPVSAWTHRVLGPTIPVKSIRMTPELIHHLLHLDKGLLGVQAPPSVNRRRRKLQVPTISMMNRETFPPPNVTFDALPLIRLLRRIMIAVHEDRSRKWLSEDDAKELAASMVKAARAEMLPEVQDS